VPLSAPAIFATGTLTSAALVPTGSLIRDGPSVVGDCSEPQLSAAAASAMRLTGGRGGEPLCRSPQTKRHRRPAQSREQAAAKAPRTERQQGVSRTAQQREATRELSMTLLYVRFHRQLSSATATDR